MSGDIRKTATVKYIDFVNIELYLYGSVEVYMWSVPDLLIPDKEDRVHLYDYFLFIINWRIST